MENDKQNFDPCIVDGADGVPSEPFAERDAAAPRSLEEITELANDQLEAELEAIEIGFGSYVNAVKTMAAEPLTAEQSPPVSALESLQQLKADVDKVCGIGS